MENIIKSKIMIIWFFSLKMMQAYMLSCLEGNMLRRTMEAISIHPSIDPYNHIHLYLHPLTPSIHSFSYLSIQLPIQALIYSFFLSFYPPLYRPMQPHNHPSIIHPLVKFSPAYPCIHLLIFPSIDQSTDPYNPHIHSSSIHWFIFPSIH